MMTTVYLARLTPARLSKLAALTFVCGVAASSLANAADSLPLIVSAARAPAAPLAARTRLAEFARTNAKTTDGALAQLALGLVEYEHNDFSGAIRDLDGLSARLPKIGDYISYYQASAQAQMNDQASASATLSQPVWDSPRSPLKSRALLLRADALT